MARAPQPGQAEVIEAAGATNLIRSDLVYEMTDPVAKAAELKKPTFNQWWGGLSNPERYRIYASCNLNYAKAAVAALENDV
jgi:hypothetical protein